MAAAERARTVSGDGDSERVRRGFIGQQLDDSTLAFCTGIEAPSSLEQSPSSCDQR